MIPLNIKEIRAAVNGRVKGIRACGKVCAVKTETDTREDLAGALYIALKGKSFDGHDFIRDAAHKGAACVVCERADGLPPGFPAVVVPSSYKALKDLAKSYMKKFRFPVVGVTGSVGKTTAKDMIASVLSVKYKTFKTEGNYNNHIGLPLSVMKLDFTYEAAVFEMGMSGFGEIRELADIVRPDICVITNIGDSHLENLGNRENVLRAKSEILDFNKPSGKIILNGDDGLLLTLKDRHRNIKYYGFNENNYLRAEDIREHGLSGISCGIRHSGGKFIVKIPVPGRHVVYSALAAAGVGFALDMDAASVKNGIESFRPPKQRMDVMNTPQGNVTVINDAYNASPASVVAALDVLASVKTRKVCVLGDMLELGDHSPEFHNIAGRCAAERGISLIICVGESARHMYDGACGSAKQGQEVLHFKTQDELFEKMDSLIHEGDTVLVKASRGMKLEKTVEFLMRNE